MTTFSKMNFKKWIAQLKMPIHETTVEFKNDKETKNTLRFTADKESDVSGSIYLTKSDLEKKGAKGLKKITVTVSYET